MLIDLISIPPAVRHELLALALIGTISSTVFLGLVFVAAQRFRQLAHRCRSAAGRIPSEQLPPVTILKPICGLEPQLEQNLKSFFELDYPDYEIVFGCRTPDDPALTVVAALRARYPHIRVRIVCSGSPAWPNAKVFSLDRMIASCSNDHFVISDSDILVTPDFLRNVISPLLDPQVGLVTCLYSGTPTKDFWSRVEALGMSIEMPSGVLVAKLMEGMKFALGAGIAVRRDALDRIGGIASISDYCADDFILGKRIAESGYSVVLSHQIVSHVLMGQGFAQTFRTQLRWMQSTRSSRPKGHLGTGLTFSMPFGLLGLFAAISLGHWRLGVALMAWAYLNRVAQAIAIGWGIIHDRRALALCWLYPLRDLLGFFVWITSYLCGSEFSWRGEEYRFITEGRFVPLSRGCIVPATTSAEPPSPLVEKTSI
ncbi:MAG: bacteriohopanetetrol glucosamine biosynthesis glycosyltransferase HpnI [Candidatus Korobacteraceae bacterium]|jgi:ceramide glucosyltransferase